MSALSLRENRSSLVRVVPTVAVQVTSSGASPVQTFVAVKLSEGPSTASSAGTLRVQVESSASVPVVPRAK